MPELGLLLKAPQDRVSRSEAETEALGEKISLLAGLEFLALTGDLGAGKTALVRGLVRGLDSSAQVQSPTFVLGRRYAGKRPVWHYDFYRLEKPGDLQALDWPPSEPGSLTVVEWADKFPEVFPGNTLWLRMGLRDAESREIRIGGSAEKRK